MMQVWEDYILTLDSSFGRKNVDRWIRTLKIVRFDACNLHLEASDAMHAHWVEEHLTPLLRKQLYNNNGHKIRVYLAVRGDNKQPQQVEQPPPSSSTHLFSPDPIEGSHTYSTFIAEKGLSLPFRILTQLTGFAHETQSLDPHFSKSPYNPIYLYGLSGSGKTHLLSAAANALQQRNLTVFYVKATTFTEHLVQAIRSGHMQEFRSAYRHVDALIIDGIQNFARKTATQEELFHTFNTLHTAGKQIILSANVNPRQLEGIEDRLVSRFEWGITLPVERIHHETTLRKIAQNRLHAYHLRLQSEVIDFMIDSFPSARALCYAVDRVAMKLSIDRFPREQNIPLTFLLPTLKELIENNAKVFPTPQKILTLVADIFGIKVEDILSKSQSREIVLPRQICMYLLRKELKMPYMKIGGVFAKDHSTVMSSIKQIAKSIETQDKEVFYYMYDIQRKMANAI